MIQEACRSSTLRRIAGVIAFLAAGATMAIATTATAAEPAAPQMTLRKVAEDVYFMQHPTGSKIGRAHV